MYPSMFNKMLDNIIMDILRNLEAGHTVIINMASNIPFYTVRSE